MIESQLTNNFYGTNMSSEKFEAFSNDKFLLIDFKTILKTKAIKKLFKFFEVGTVEESRDVLSGYVIGVLTKIHEVSNDMLPLFLNQNSELIEKMTDHLDNTSVNQLILLLLTDNSWIKEDESSIKKTFVSIGTFEVAYSSVYTSKSRNDLFPDSSDSILPEKLINWEEKLDKQEMNLVQNTIIEELKQLPENLSNIKKVTINLFHNLLKNFNKNQLISLNLSSIIYQTICKSVDLLIEHSSHDFPTCMNRFDKEDEPFISVWENNDEIFYTGLFNSAEAKVSYDMFSKIIKELFNEQLYSNKLKNMAEFLNLTVFAKKSIKKYLEFFIEKANLFKSGNLLNISCLDFLCRIIICSLHFENLNNSLDNHCIQNIIDNFSELLSLLNISKNSNQIVMEGSIEKQKLGSHRKFILKLFIHCFLVNNTKFNLCVSTSDFANILLKLLEIFADNDRFMQVFYQIIYTSLKTKHETMLNILFCEVNKKKILYALMTNNKSNKFFVLKLLKLFDKNFIERCFAIGENKSGSKELPVLNNNMELDTIKEYVYIKLDKEIKCYENLDKERKDRFKRKDTDSSMFSNNLLDDSDKFESSNLKNLINSDPPQTELPKEEEVHNDFEIELDEEEEIDFKEDTNTIRRRKISEDNIQLSGNIRENNKKNMRK